MLAKYPRGLPKDLEEGFQLLDSEGGAGWDLAAQLVAYNPDDRPTASQALVHPFIANSPVLPVSVSPSGTGTVMATGATAAASAVRSLGSTVGTVSKKVAEVLPQGGRGGFLFIVFWRPSVDQQQRGTKAGACEAAWGDQGACDGGTYR